MGKRINAVGNMKTTKSHKTKKRLEKKKEMLAKRALKKNNRKYVGKK